MTDAADTDTYALKSVDTQTIPAPQVDYLPPEPKGDLAIGMIGTGGISVSHLDAYRAAGWRVAAMWNRTRENAEAKAAEYAPSARIEDDWRAILSDPGIDIVDITLHPEHRTPIVREALRAGKHVLSQKPFVTDLEVGEDLVKLAGDRDCRLAVNQNGRWAPHMAYMRQAVKAGLLGDVLSIHASVHWDHGWTAGTDFDAITDLILFDFGVHWFDFVASITGERLQTVRAMAGPAQGQANKVPLLAQSIIGLDGGQASLVFDGGIPFGARDTTFVGGTRGSIKCDGPDLGQQSLTLTTDAGVAEPPLKGQWFNDGFRGTMGELMCAIEQGREPSNAASENLLSLALTFAAVESRITGKEVPIGQVRRLPS